MTKMKTNGELEEQGRLADWRWALRAGLIAAFIAALVLVGKDGISATDAIWRSYTALPGDAPELPAEWRWEAKTLSFDHMYRARAGAAAAPWVCRSEAQCRRTASAR